MCCFINNFKKIDKKVNLRLKTHYMNLKGTALLVSFIAISQYSSSQSDSSKFIARRDDSVNISDRDFKDSVSGKRQGKKMIHLLQKRKLRIFF
jgi:hypothetical protein